MATKKPKGAQRLTKNQQELRTLAKAGIYSGDWRNAKVASGAQKRLRAKFKDQIKDLDAGKLRAVKVPRGAKVPKDMPVAKGRAFVRAEKGERVRYNRKSGEFTSIVYRDGVKFRRIILSTDPDKVGDLLKKPGLYYQVPFKQMGINSPLFEDPEELARFMADYEKKRFKDWLNYVEVLQLVDMREEDEVEAYDA
jgi:hypothetical protein